MRIQICHQHKTRSGFGLVEMILATFLFSLSIGLFVAFQGQLLKLGNSSADHLQQLVITGRLARVLRTDIHLARSAELASIQGNTGKKNPLDLRLFLGNQKRIEYTLEDDHVGRTVIEDNTTRQTDEFPLMRCLGTWSLENEPGTTLVSLRLDRPLNASGKPAPRPMRIEAVLGFDHRLESGAKP